MEIGPCSFPASPQKFPDPSTREFVFYRFEKLEELRANFHEICPFAVNFPVFSRLSGNPHAETGSRWTASATGQSVSNAYEIGRARNAAKWRRPLVYDEVKAERDRLADRPYSWPLARK